MGKLSLLSICLSLICIGLVNARVKKKPTSTPAFYELNKGNFSAKFTNQGACVVSIIVPDRDGVLADVVLGFGKASDYKNNMNNFGALVARDAGRIGNATFKLDGKTYKLNANDGSNTLHGGMKGLGNVTWDVYKHVNSGRTPYLIFNYTSPDGDQGFPGTLDVTVTYKITQEYTLSITIEAIAKDKSTPFNAGLHTYYNLAGHGSGSIYDAMIQIYASNITVLDKELVATGQIQSVQGTPNDLRELSRVGDSIDALLPRGFDTDFVVDNRTLALRPVAKMYDKKTGRVLTVQSNNPVVQLYTGFGLEGAKGKDGVIYDNFGGLSLGPQGYPNAVNHPNSFKPSIVKYGGKPYRHLIQYMFSTDLKCVFDKFS